MPNTQRPGGKGFGLPTGSDPHSVRQRVEAMEMLLERSFRIPGINYPVGLDAIVGLVPVLGDLVTAAMGTYALWEARNLRSEEHTSELQSLMRNSYAVFCLKKKKQIISDLQCV